VSGVKSNCGKVTALSSLMKKVRNNNQNHVDNLPDEQAFSKML